MGFYRDAVFPRLMNKMMDNEHIREIRTRVCGGLAGDVVEIGFGTGLNLPHLPAEVTSLRAVDPLEVGAKVGASRLAESPLTVEFAGLDGQSLPFPDHSVDAVLSTWTLCSIPDATAALREVRRVLRPGGALHFVEHGASPEEGVRRWQDRLDPVQRRMACGCHLNRDIPALIEAGGLSVRSLDTYYAKGEPKAFGWTFEGTAVPA